MELEGLLKATTCEECSSAELATYGAAVRAAAAADADFPAGLLALASIALALGGLGSLRGPHADGGSP